MLPLEKVIGLEGGDETIEKEGIYDGLEIDLVTHDVKKFFTLLLRKNGYVLEQLLSPLVELTSPEHEELVALAPQCITRHHAHHYLGFAATQWKLFRKEQQPRVKPLLYTYRVLLTGIHLMLTGEVEANLIRLNEEANLSSISDLIELKQAGPEKGVLPEADLAFHEREFTRLEQELREVQENSHLPEHPTAKPALNDLLVRLRMKTA